jgi:hypothetical protein
MKLLKYRKYTLLKLLIVAAVFFSLHACKTKAQDCYQSVIVMTYADFKARDYQIDTIRSSDSTTIVIDTVPLFNDTTLKNPEFTYIQNSASDSFVRIVDSQSYTLGAPLNPSTDSIRYRFRSESTSNIADTITFYYTPTIHFINNSCGYTYYYNLQNVKTTSHMLDSAAIINGVISGDNTNGSNVYFYFKKNP